MSEGRIARMSTPVCLLRPCLSPLLLFLLPLSRSAPLSAPPAVCSALATLLLLLYYTRIYQAR